MATITAQWWGLQIGLTHAEAVQVESGEIARVLESLAGSALFKAAWWAGALFVIWVAVEDTWMKDVDHGNGVYVNLAWMPTIAWLWWWTIYPSTR